MISMLRNLPLTIKLSAIIVVINLIGLAGLAVYTLRTEVNSQLVVAEGNWTQTNDQFASLTAGAVKWGKVEPIREAYGLYRDDPALNLVQFVAFNAELQPVDTWVKTDVTDVPSAEELAKITGGAAEKTFLDKSRLGDNLLTVVSPIPGKSGKPGGFVATTWSSDSMVAVARDKALFALMVQAAFIAVAVAAFLTAMRKLVGQPLRRISDRIVSLQRGDLDGPVPYQANGDEIGFLARALDGFRMDAIAKLEQDRRSEEQNRALDAERARNAKISQQAAASQQAVMATLATSLERLARGDFTALLQNVPPEFAKLQQDFNAMIDAVAAAITEIKEAATTIEDGSSELAKSADQLAKRTEQQAASLEETAAALGQVTTMVQNSAANAQNAGRMVEEAETGARSAADRMEKAIDAMGRIQTSSSQIGQIIGVIDEIAFQTNLLALNAGVEAARAGEAGKGFAVVAQEVRELAQRSANAAKEIKQLVSVSSDQVGSGVGLVNETGEALMKIDGQIKRINESIAAIISSYQEQSSGLQEINSAINQMDQTTQQNAAMVEETNAACQGLLSQSQLLKGASGRFDVGQTAPQPPRVSAPAGESRRPVAPRASRPVAITSVHGNAAVKQSWEEF